MTPEILVIHLQPESDTESVTFLDQSLRIRRISCGGDLQKAAELVREYDGRVAAIALEGIPTHLQLGPAKQPYPPGAAVAAEAQKTPVVDGSGIRAGLERWGVILADRAQPGIFSQKHVLMTPGLNHNGLAQALGRRAAELRYADPLVYFAMPAMPGVGSRWTLDRAAAITLSQLADEPVNELLPQPNGRDGRAVDGFEWADILAGDIGMIRHYAPESLKRKTVVVEWATEADLADLRERGVSIAVTMMPSLDGNGELGRWSAATIEAVLIALQPEPSNALSARTPIST